MVSKSQEILLTAVAIFAAYLVYQRLSVSEEDRIMETFKTVESGLEQKQSSTVLSVISKDYEDSRNRRRTHIRDMLLMFSRAVRNVMVSIREGEIKIDGDKAEVELMVTVSLTIQSENPALQTEDGSNPVLVFLTREGGDWKVTSAEFPPRIEQWLQRMPRMY
tara:strand:- start:22 stop:510 length:489 start_codon:yes stop_codon:yes gene_type:complete